MLDTLKTLCQLDGVSGWEDEVRDYILERVMPYASSVETDSMGNLIVTKKGKKTPARKILLAAHMDEVGIIVTRIADDGFVPFDFIGGVDRRVVIGKRGDIGRGRVPGIIGSKPIHLLEKGEEKTVPKLDDMYIDIGAATKEEAENLVSLGVEGVFVDSVLEFGDGFLKAKAIDDRVGCAAMLRLLEQELPCDCTFAFTVQEEVGTRGATIAAARVKPDVAIVLEGTTAADLPGVDEGKRICKLGGGLVLPFMDRGTLYTPALWKRATEIADANGIQWQTKTRIAGGTDARVIQRGGMGCAVVAISAPIRNIHSPASVAKFSDFRDMPKLALLLLEALAED